MTAPFNIPFLLGIAGHRDLVADEVPMIRGYLTRLFGRLKNEYPEVPLSLLCSMADGADLLAADVALDLGISIVALLPYLEQGPLFQQYNYQFVNSSSTGNAPPPGAAAWKRTKAARSASPVNGLYSRW